jgi:hypothetical protein
MTERSAPVALSTSRLCLIVSFVLFVIAAVLAVGLVRGSVEPFALLGLGFWALSGAV